MSIIAFPAEKLNKQSPLEYAQSYFLTPITRTLHALYNFFQAAIPRRPVTAPGDLRKMENEGNYETTHFHKSPPLRDRKR